MYASSLLSTKASVGEYARGCGYGAAADLGGLVLTHHVLRRIMLLNLRDSYLIRSVIIPPSFPGTTLRPGTMEASSLVRAV